MATIKNIETGLYRIPLSVTLSDSTHGQITAFELITVRIRDADDAEAQVFDDCRAVGLSPRWKHALHFVGCGVEPSDGRRTAIGREDVAVVGDRAGHARKARQRGDVPLRIVVDHLDAVARSMRDEDAPGLRIECGVVEVAMHRNSTL